MNQEEPATAPASPPTRRRGRRLMWVIVLCAVLAIGSIAFGCFFGQSGDSTGSDGKLISITVTNPLLTEAAGYVLLGSLASMLILAVVALFRKLWLIGVVSIVVPIPLFGVGFIAMVMTAFLAWSVVDQCRGPDGKQYAYLLFAPPFSQGQTLVLGRASRQNGWQATYDVLGETNGDSPSSWTAVIRPADCSGSDGSRLLAPGGWLVGLKYDNKCYFAYKVSTGKFLAHEGVKDISPLILMGPDTEPLAGDVAAILAGGENVPGTAGRTVASLRAEAAKHPNTKIRELFKEMPGENSTSGPKDSNESKALIGPQGSVGPKGRQHLAGGVSPRKPVAYYSLEPQRGDRRNAPICWDGVHLSPLRGSCSLRLLTGGLRPRPNAVAPSGLKEALVYAWGSET